MRPFKPIIRNLLLHPLRVSVVDDQREWKNFHLLIGAFHLARAMQRATDRPRIGVMLPTSGMFPLTLIATWMLGRTIVPLNYLLKREDIDYIINDAELDTVVTVGKMIEMFGENPGGVTSLMLEDVKFKGFPPLRWPRSVPDDALAALLYTSGTSGRPKGVMLTADNIASNVEQCIEWAGFTPKDVMLGVLPQFHSFGLTILTVAPLMVGCKAVYTARFIPKKIVSLASEHHPTVFVGIPSMYNALQAAKDVDRDAFKSLRYAVSGAEPLPESVTKSFMEKFGVQINEGYGLTETSPVTNWCRPQEHRDKSVGKPLPRVEERIVDLDGTVLGPNQDGEVRIKGPNIMKGYFKLPDETAAVFDDEGFFRTGDMGQMDDDGFLYITGRIKEMLIISGENVFPREIEEVLNKHASVHASAVIGMPDESRGELPLAFVELEEDAEFDAKALRSFCRETLPPYKVPREIRCVKELPRNATGKIMRRKLNPDTPSEV